MPNKSRQAWSVYASAILVASIMVHASTFRGIDILDLAPWVMVLHGLIFPAFGAGIFFVRDRLKGTRNPLTLVAGAPVWLKTFTAALLVYATINFLTVLGKSEGGSPEVVNGSYQLMSHGRVLRALTEAEYHYQRSLVARLFSGHWMAFSAAGLLMLKATQRQREPTL
jgi:hypothetical protein